MKKKRASKRKPGISRGMRRLRTLLLLLTVGGVIFFRVPLMEFVKAATADTRKPAVAATADAEQFSASSGAFAIRKGVIYQLTEQSLNGYKAEGSLLWSKTLSEKTAGLFSSYDGVFILTAQEDKLLRYSPLGKLLGTVAVPGEFTAVSESLKGIVFEDRGKNAYTWTDVTGKILATHEMTEEHVLKSVVDPESGDTVIATLKNDGNAIESALYRFDYAGRLSGARTFKDAIVLDMNFLKARLMVVLDNKLISLDPQMRDHWLIKEPARYQDVSFSEESFWVNRTQGESQTGQMIQCYLGSGELKASVSFKESLNGMSAGANNQVAIATKSSIRIYSNKDTIGDEIQLSNAPTRVTWIDDSHLMVYYTDGAEIVKTNKRTPL